MPFRESRSGVYLFPKGGSKMQNEGAVGSFAGLYSVVGGIRIMKDGNEMNGTCCMDI